MRKEPLREREKNYNILDFYFDSTLSRFLENLQLAFEISRKIKVEYL